MTGKCGKCGSEMTARDAHDCVAALEARSKALRLRLERARGVLESDLWLATKGLAAYKARVSGRSLAQRRTRPIRWEHYRRISDGSQCPGCCGQLEFRRNPRGGSYYACRDLGHDCYYIGWNSRTGVGYESIVTAADEASVRKAG